MRLKRIALFVLALLNIGVVAGQDSIDYQDRSLLRNLAKNNVHKDLQHLPVPEAVSDQYSYHGKFFKSHHSENVSQVKYIYVGRVNSCRAGGCSSPGMGSSAGKSEYFDYFILFNVEKEVELVRVFNYQATHGYEVTARGWLRQFEGYDGSKNLEVNKNIDGITGATISVEAITRDVEKVNDILRAMD
ncbi:MAG: FMN-binding protein [Bacteroidales bacterium]|nr:FMN-binding protein [Bacteroidales bacterium]